MRVAEILKPVHEEVDNIINDRDASYVPVPKKKKKKQTPDDKARVSLINTLWLYNNADAS